VIPATLPAIKMRGGRVNFKFADTKSVLYFDDTDLEVAPGEGGAVELRFSGVPSRTDQGAQNFGHFYVRGTATPSAVRPAVQLSGGARAQRARRGRAPVR
jgi:hypothetical protein